jgi:hypothetical protein
VCGVNEREALALVRRLLAEALDRPNQPTTFVRDLSERIGDLRATMRAAVTVIDQTGADQ